MNAKLQTALDKLAMSLSAICAVHCLLMPIAIVMLPALASLPFAGEGFHFLLLFMIIPSSVVALFLGCKVHKNKEVVVWIVAGIMLLIAAVLLGHDVFGEVFEKVTTFIGALLVSIGHFKNYRLCRSKKC